MTRNDCCREKENLVGQIVSDGGPRVDEILNSLANIRRRYTLHYLQEAEQASITDVAQQIGEWEHNCPVDDIPEEEIITLETALYHNHIPKLRMADIVEYDERSEMLVYRDPPELVEVCLEHCTDRDFPD